MSKKAEKIDLDALLEAIKELKINGKSIRSVASQYNIPKSNLSRYISNLTANNVDFATADANDIKDMAKHLHDQLGKLNVLLVQPVTLISVFCAMKICRKSIPRKIRPNASNANVKFISDVSMLLRTHLSVQTANLMVNNRLKRLKIL